VGSGGGGQAVVVCQGLVGAVTVSVSVGFLGPANGRLSRFQCARLQRLCGSGSGRVHGISGVSRFSAVWPLPGPPCRAARSVVRRRVAPLQVASTAAQSPWPPGWRLTPTGPCHVAKWCRLA